MNNTVLKKTIVNVIGLVGFAALSSFSQAASFDCAKAAAPIEKLICSDEATSKLDADLAAVYKAAMQKTDKSDDLKLQQRAWLKEKRNLCKDAACIVQVYQARTADLVNLSTAAAGETSSEKVESANKKFITFTLVEGDGYPLCKEYVDMLNKTKYTEIPACSRKILPEFSNFKEIKWVEMTDKEEMIKIAKERMAVQQALNPKNSKQLYNPKNRIERISEGKETVSSFKMHINDDGKFDVVYKYQTPRSSSYVKYGHCNIFHNYYVEDSKININSISNSSFDPYSVFNISGSNELFLYGDNLYLSFYAGKYYYQTNLDVYRVGNDKICGIIAK